MSMLCRPNTATSDLQAKTMSKRSLPGIQKHSWGMGQTETDIRSSGCVHICTHVCTHTVNTSNLIVSNVNNKAHLLQAKHLLNKQSLNSLWNNRVYQTVEVQ